MNTGLDQSDRRSASIEAETGDEHMSRPPEKLLQADGLRIEELEAELATMRDRWMRSEAEAVNIRGRAKREIDDSRQFAIQKFAADVVEAAENLRRGLESIPAAVEGEPEIVARIREGLVSVERSFIGLLKRNGVEKEDPTGSAFDPQRHQGMVEEASANLAPGTVLRALSGAWTLNGRLLRPAMVVVAKATV